MTFNTFQQAANKAMMQQRKSTINAEQFKLRMEQAQIAAVAAALEGNSQKAALWRQTADVWAKKAHEAARIAAC